MMLHICGGQGFMVFAPSLSLLWPANKGIERLIRIVSQRCVRLCYPVDNENGPEHEEAKTITVSCLSASTELYPFRQF